jgi:hypothetical protein
MSESDRGGRRPKRSPAAVGAANSGGQPDEIYQAVTRIFAGVIAIFGVVILIVTLANGGTVTSSGVWLGLIFVGLGAGRLYLALRPRSRSPKDEAEPRRS